MSFCTFGLSANWIESGHISLSLFSCPQITFGHYHNQWDTYSDSNASTSQISKYETHLYLIPRNVVFTIVSACDLWWRPMTSIKNIRVLPLNMIILYFKYEKSAYPSLLYLQAKNHKHTHATTRTHTHTHTGRRDCIDFFLLWQGINNASMQW